MWFCRFQQDVQLFKATENEHKPHLWFSVGGQKWGKVAQYTNQYAKEEFMLKLARDTGREVRVKNQFSRQTGFRENHTLKPKQSNAWGIHSEFWVMRSDMSQFTVLLNGCYDWAKKLGGGWVIMVIMVNHNVWRSRMTSWPLQVCHKSQADKHETKQHKTALNFISCLLVYLQL